MAKVNPFELSFNEPISLTAGSLPSSPYCSFIDNHSESANWPKNVILNVPGTIVWPSWAWSVIVVVPGLPITPWICHWTFPSLPMLPDFLIWPVGITMFGVPVPIPDVAGADGMFWPTPICGVGKSPPSGHGSTCVGFVPRCFVTTPVNEKSPPSIVLRPAAFWLNVIVTPVLLTVTVPMSTPLSGSLGLLGLW